MVLDDLSVPVVLAPLAGGPSTPELAAAVSGAGGLGFVASGYLSASQLAERLRSARALTDRPLAVNVFHPGDGPTPPVAYAEFVARLRDWARPRDIELGEPAYSDDDWEAKLELLAGDPVAAVSFTFGCPEPGVVERLRAVGSEVWVTVTSPEEARRAQDAGADVLVVQGAEAGGHRGSFADSAELPVFGLLALLALIRAEVTLPLVAAGGIADGAAVAAVLCAGARAAALGTAFMLCPEAGTSAAHRAALATDRTTALTRAFSGRLARGIKNGFMAAHDDAATIAYPELHYVTAPMRKRAREQGNAELINLWAGEAHALARELPAAEVVARLRAELEAALDGVVQRARRY